jgi:uncharacterized protein (DUF433 family)
MQREPAAFLWDVHESALRIREFVFGHDFEAFSASVLLQSAIERQFEIIGEALKQSRTRVEKLDRITQRPETMGGKACIRGIRVTVSMIVGQIGTGRGVDDLLAEYPYLEREDILQALRYAARRT